jgi:hypothetical protein
VFQHKKNKSVHRGWERAWGEHKDKRIRKRKKKKEKSKKEKSLTGPTCACTNSRIEV